MIYPLNKYVFYTQMLTIEYILYIFRLFNLIDFALRPNMCSILVNALLLLLLLLLSLQSCPTLQPHRQQPTRLCCPWDSPVKNTGVGCHFLLLLKYALLEYLPSIGLSFQTLSLISKISNRVFCHCFLFNMAVYSYFMTSFYI